MRSQVLTLQHFCQGWKLKTTHELMKALGISNRRTLQRWQKLGLIPPPRLEKNELGNAVIGTWDDWVLPHCQVIRGMQKQGQSNTKIAEILGSNWDEISLRYKRRYVFADVSAAIDQSIQFNTAVEKTLKTISADIELFRRVFSPTSFPVTRAHIQNAIQIYESGFSPMLLVRGSEVMVASTIAIGIHISELTNPESMMVLPLEGLIAELVKDCNVKTKFRISRTVESRTGKKEKYRVSLTKSLGLSKRRIKN